MKESTEASADLPARPASPSETNSATEKRTRVSSPASSPKKRKTTSLPTETVEYLKAWMMSPEHIAHPYPTEQEKAKIMDDTKIELKQLTNWFVNNRKRYWKPRVEARLNKQQTTTAGVASLPQVVSTTSVPALVEKDRLQSPVNNRFVSEASSSDDESLTTDSSVQGPIMMEEPLLHQETVRVHVLKHAASEPTLEHVSVLSSIPNGRILQTFYVPMQLKDLQDPKKLQSRRSAEIVKIKKQILREYIDQHQASLEQEQQQPKVYRKRTLGTEQSTPRSKFRRVSVQLWKDVCQSAPCYDHETLPTLEEASQLFGYSSQ